MKEFDVWACYVNARTSYRAVEATGPVKDAEPPFDGARHLDRVVADSKLGAVSLVVRLIQKRFYGGAESCRSGE